MFNQFRTGIHRLAASVRLSDIINDVPVVQLTGPVNAEVDGVTTDSRRVKDRWMFVATEGEHVDGHRFVQKAVEHGASVVVVQRRQYQESLQDLLTPSYVQHNATTLLIVEDTRIAVALLAARFYGSPAASLRMIGITGTNGKTTCGYLVKSILEYAGETVGMIGTVEYQIGNVVIPATYTTPPAEELHRVLRAMSVAGCTSVVMEVSSHALALKRVYGLSFDVTLFTNLTQDHLDFHGTMTVYRDAKRLLFSEHTKSAGVINTDDLLGAYMADALGRKKRSYGTSPRTSFRMNAVETTRKGIAVRIQHRGKEVTVKSPLLGRFNAYNVTAAYAVGIMLGIDERAIIRGIQRLRNVPGRFECLYSQNGVLAIVDYSHTPDALAKALETCRTLVEKKGRVFTVFGCGGERDPGKRPLMGNIASRNSDVVIVTSDNPRGEDPDAIIDDILAGVIHPSNVLRKTNRRAAIHHALRVAKPGDVVLIAGKGHEAAQIIGNRRRHFDDREVVRAYFETKRGGLA